MQWKAFFAGDIVIDQLPGHDLLSPELAAILRSHAISSCNFEAPVKGKSAPIKKAGPHLSQHPQAPALLEKAGFNVINLANNHIYDYGQEALTQTIHAFQHAVCVGAGNNFAEANALKVINVQHLKVGLLSFCEAEFGAITLNRSNKGGYAWINHPAVNNLITEAKKNTDILLVQVHAGVEELEIPLPEWRERYRELVRLGADAVIGSHPHVPQGWETYLDKPIFFSLGNFYFDWSGTHPLWNKGIAVSLVFDHKKLVNVEVIPVERTTNGVGINRNGSFEQYLDSLNKQLEEPGYTTSINEQALSLWERYYRNYYDLALQGINEQVPIGKAFRSFVKRLLFRKKTSINTALLLHNIRIESHRWMVERALEQKIEQ